MPDLLTPDAIAARLRSLEGWSVDDDGQLAKTYSFDTYLSGADFARRAAGIAETLNHHPDIRILWRKVSLAISTHSAGGITELDFEFATAVERSR